MLQKLVKIAVVAVSMGSGPAAHAALMFDFAGQLQFNGLGFVSRDAVTGTIAYDETAPDASHGAGFGLYRPGTVTSLEFSIAGNSILERDLSDSGYAVNLNPADRDRIEFVGLAVAFDSGASSCNNLALCELRLSFLDLSQAVLAGNAPVDAAPSVEQLSAIGVRFGSLRVASATVDFSIDSVTERTDVAVAAPHTTPLHAMALLGRLLLRPKSGFLA